MGHLHNCCDWTKSFILLPVAHNACHIDWLRTLFETTIYWRSISCGSRVLVKNITIMGTHDAYFSNLLQNLADSEDHTNWYKWKYEQSFSVWNPQKLHITTRPYKSRPPHIEHQKCALTQIKLTRKDAGEHCSGAEEKEREVHFRCLLRCTALTALGLIVGGGTTISLHLSIKLHMMKGKCESYNSTGNGHKGSLKLLTPMNILSSWPH